MVTCAGSKAGIDGAQLTEAFDQQRRRHEQRDRQADLSDRQRLLRAHRARARAARSIGEPARQPRAHHAEGGNRAGQQRRQRSMRRRQTSAVRSVDVDARASPGIDAGPSSTMMRTSAIASTRPATPPASARAQRFGDHLQRQPRAAGAERGADREFAPPADAAREQQVRDVRARQQQDERHRRHQQADRAPRARVTCSTSGTTCARHVAIVRETRARSAPGCRSSRDRADSIVDAGRKPADDREIVRAALPGLEIGRVRHPQFGRAPPAAGRAARRRADTRTPAASRR